jgi:hypothetical protein
MEKIGGVCRDGLLSRPPATAAHAVFEITRRS